MGLFALVDDDDFESVSLKSWHLTKNKNKIYPRCSYWQDGRIVNKRLHNYLLKSREGLVIDHINGNTLDNRRENLRYVTQKVNAQNRVKNPSNKSGTRGVHFDKGRKRPSGGWRTKPRWVASIYYEGKQLYLGGFEKKDEAIKARKEAEKIYYPFSVV